MSGGYASRAGEKLEYAIKKFNIDVNSMTCADFGASTGGFVDCLLEHGVERVYAIETGYGVLDWKLRNDKRVVVMERTNAMHINLPEKVDLVTIDTSWTKLEKTLPNAIKNIRPGGHIIALAKPHYEASPEDLVKGKLLDDKIPEVLGEVKEKIKENRLKILKMIESPIVGKKGGNKEFIFHLKRHPLANPTIPEERTAQ